MVSSRGSVCRGHRLVAFGRPWAWNTAVPVLTETAATPTQSPTVEITYIANEGVLISSGGKQVLIDGLHREYGPEYAFLPPVEREKIETPWRCRFHHYVGEEELLATDKYG